MIGAYGIGSLTTGAIITVTFDVVIDGHNDGLEWNAALGTYTAGDTVARNDANAGSTGWLNDGANSVLAFTGGNAIILDDPGYLNYQQVSFSFTIGDEIAKGTATNGEDVAFRLFGATNTAIIDNVSIDVVPEPSTTALIGLGGLALILRRRR